VSSAPAEPEGYLVGRGIADVTGEPAGCGMLGYGMRDQVSEGIHLRLRARAFVIADAESGRRVLLVIADLPLMFDTVRREVLRRLAARHGDTYGDDNVLVAATHTHCGPGGYAGYWLYDSTTHGFHQANFDAIVEGIVEAAERAHRDVSPAVLRVARGELRDASVNRSRPAFERNPPEDRAFFPDAIDPQTTVLRIERERRVVGAINWFPTHGTSMTNRNRLISGDNKGYAGYWWERLEHAVDYRSAAEPSFVGAFAQTNAGDMSPNLALKPGAGPTGDQVENTRIIGERQGQAAARLLTAPGVELAGGLDARTVHVDFGRITVEPEFSGDGRRHRTSPAVGGAAAFAGAAADGPAFRTFTEGRNPVWDQLSRQVFYRFSARLRDAQAPKGMLVPASFLNRFTSFSGRLAPLQLIRIGSLYLVAIPGEVTIVAGLRLRRTVAAVVGADLTDVLVAGYSNAYIHYVTTPEEYDAQHYEGGSTVFGRWELPAICQVAAGLARSLGGEQRVPDAAPPPDTEPLRHPVPEPPPPDEAPPGRTFGDVLAEPAPSYRVGSLVEVVFVGAHPNNDLHRGGTYLFVERQAGDGWDPVADDGDWSTTFRWARVGRASSAVTVTWLIPPDAVAGRYRVHYHGDTRDSAGQSTPFVGTSRAFEVTDASASGGRDGEELP
jgi:neutral ceramidase